MNNVYHSKFDPHKKDIDPEFHLSGFYRGKVTEVDIEENKYGAVRVFIPQLMTDTDPDYDEGTMGLIAYPLNNYMGGYNEDDEGSYFQASVHVPLKGAWVCIMFEGGNANRPFYFGAFNFRHAEVPPENLGVKEPHKVHTLKMQSGRSLIFCDSEDQARVEITGKRRQLQNSKPSGEGGVYNIDGNMNTILLDERDGSEKLLIRTYKGDYIHVDIDEQQLQCYFKNDIIIQTDGNLHFRVKKDINFNAEGNIQWATNGDSNYYSGGSVRMTQGGTFNVKSDGINAIDGLHTFIQTPMAQPSPTMVGNTTNKSLSQMDSFSGGSGGGLGELTGMAGGAGSNAGGAGAGVASKLSSIVSNVQIQMKSVTAKMKAKAVPEGTIVPGLPRFPLGERDEGTGLAAITSSMINMAGNIGGMEAVQEMIGGQLSNIPVADLTQGIAAGGVGELGNMAGDIAGAGLKGAMDGISSPISGFGIDGLAGTLEGLTGGSGIGNASLAGALGGAGGNLTSSISKAAEGITGSLPIDQVGTIVDDLSNNIPLGSLDSLTNSADQMMGKLEGVTRGVTSSIPKEIFDASALGDIDGLNVD